MAFNIDLLKKHPYETGAVVIVGGIVLFYLISGGQGTSKSTSSNLAAQDTSAQQAAAAAAIQTNGQNVALQQSQIAASVQNYQTSAAADVSNTQTLAALVAALNGNQTNLQVTQSNNDAATLQQMNEEIASQNIMAIQEAGIINQTNQAFNIQANNNATSLEGLKYTLDAQGKIAEQTIASATGLAQQQQTAYDAQIPYIVQHAGDSLNSGLDKTTQASVFQTILAQGNPSVAATGTNASGNVAVNGNNTGAAVTNSIISSVSNLAGKIGAGFFG